MDLKEHHLILLMEECAEVAHRASKQLRFGPNEVQPGQPLTNSARLRIELLDVFACVLFLEGSGQIEPIRERDVLDHMAMKASKITRMLALSRTQGCLTDSASPEQVKP